MERWFNDCKDYSGEKIEGNQTMDFYVVQQRRLLDAEEYTEMEHLLLISIFAIVVIALNVRWISLLNNNITYDY